MSDERTQLVVIILYTPVSVIVNCAHPGIWIQTKMCLQYGMLVTEGSPTL
jgi:hypothetical protein